MARADRPNGLGFDRSTNLATSRSQRVVITRGSAADGLREGVGKIERVKKVLAELIGRPCPKKIFSPGLISNL